MFELQKCQLLRKRIANVFLRIYTEYHNLNLFRKYLVILETFTYLRNNDEAYFSYFFLYILLFQDFFTSCSIFMIMTDLKASIDM